MNVVAYIDEAGAKGFSRNLTPERDDEIGLICAVLYPADRVDEMREAYRAGFDAFCSAAPAGEKHHVTDAFKPGNEAWGNVARLVRGEFEEIIRLQTPPIVYDARRLSLQRDAHERLEAIIGKRRASEQKGTVRVSQRPSAERVESDLIDGLALKLDALASDMSWREVALHFDDVDDALIKHYRERIDHLRELSSSVRLVKGWDMAVVCAL